MLVLFIYILEVLLFKNWTNLCVLFMILNVKIKDFYSYNKQIIWQVKFDLIYLKNVSFN